MDFYDKETYTIEDIKHLIEYEKEENIHLDFKDAQPTDVADLLSVTALSTLVRASRSYP